MRWLIDEMLPPGLAEELEVRGHDAVSVATVDLAGARDDEVYTCALDEERAIVTENFSDYAQLTSQRVAQEEPTVVVVFVRKSSFPRKGLARHLASHLDAWARAHPDPFAGIHWP